MKGLLEDLKERINVNTRARTRIKRMKRDEPLPIEQVHENAPESCRDRVRYHRNLYRYKIVYKRTRIPLLDPRLEDL